MTRAAVVGLGWWGATLVGQAQGIPGLQISHGVDVSPAGRERGVALGLTMHASLDEVLAEAEVDAVILCTPHQLHADQVVAVARAGKHVFCEKPFTETLDDADRALSAVAAAGVIVGIGHERRFEPAVQLLRSSAEAGELGEVLSFEGNFSQDKFLALPADNWRLSTDFSPVGPLSATGIHMVDLAISLLGRPTRLWATLFNNGTGFPNGDTLSIMIEFAGSRTALISAILSTPFVGRLALYGSSGWVEIRDRTHPESPTGWDVTTTLRGQAPVTQFHQPFPAARANLEAFAAAADGGPTYPVDHEEIRATVAAYEAIVHSVRKNGPVDLP